MGGSEQRQEPGSGTRIYHLDVRFCFAWLMMLSKVLLKNEKQAA